MVKPALRTKSIGFKVSEEEYAQLDAAAHGSGRSLGEWCREALLENASGRETKPTASGGAEAQALMAELMALRTILLNVLFKQTNGESLTAEEMQRLIDRADADKLRKARERLARADTGGAPGPPADQSHAGRHGGQAHVLPHFNLGCPYPSRFSKGGHPQP